VIEVGASDGGPKEVEIGAQRALPAAVGVLPLRDMVTFPDMLVPLNVGQPRSIELINDVLGGDRTIAMVATRTPDVEVPGPDDLYAVGVLGVVARMIRVPDGTIRILVQGGQRVRIKGWDRTEPYLVAEIAEAPDIVKQTPELVALMRNVQQTFSSIVEEVPYLPEELQVMVANVDDPSALSHLIAGALRLKTEEKQQLLEELDVAKRLRRLSEILARELEVVAIGSKIQSQVQSELEKGQREFFLRSQLKAIQDELGETDEAQAEAGELREQLAALELPEEARKQVDRELARLARLQPAMAEYGVVRGYLEWIAALPWGTSTEDKLDLAHARKVLDEDHYDIEQVKDRILEFLAVRILKPDARGSILLFVGPPGVGKTSLGREVLDPEQNRTFRDHYLDLPFDLSNVMFITTANTLETIPGPLRDRMEMIQLAGYTEAEKLEIAKRYLVPRQIERNGLRPSRIAFSDTALRAIIADYTREAGVRQLEREIGAVCRKIARQFAEGKAKRKVMVTEPRVRELLGRRKFFSESRRRTSRPGVATGLAWTPVGGDVLFIEATAMPGSGKLQITGQLGDVMKESAQAALSYLRSHADELFPELAEDYFATHDIHIHVPAGAIPKDGPSAGITIASALASLLSGRPIRAEVAMTGEITLTGQVLPIGGLKEKALAAQRAGIRRIIAPALNEYDIEEIPAHLRKDLEFVFVSEIGQVFDEALETPRARRRARAGVA